MNATTKSAIALGAASFAVTMWVLASGYGVPQSDPVPQPAAVRGGASPNDFESAMRAAVQLGSTPEGLKYQDLAGPLFANALQERLSSCLVGWSPGQAAFAIVVGVAPDGAVSSTWASPETPLASCVLHRLARAALPPPPIPDVWMAANINPDTAASESEPER